MSRVDQIEILRERVDRYLGETPLTASTDHEGDVMVPVGGTVVWLRSTVGDEGRPLVRVWAITNVGMEVTAELTRFLVTTNATLLFGALHLDEQRPAVFVAHSLLGDYLNRDEFHIALAAVAGAAERFAPEIKKRFGGNLFTET